MPPLIPTQVSRVLLNSHRDTSRPDDSISEVIIAPPALYLIPILDLLRKDVKVAAQNCHSKTSGAFTGEIRCAPPDLPISLV